MQVNYELLDKLRRAARAAAAVSTGLMSALLAAHQHESSCAAALTAAKAYTASWPPDRGYPDETRREAGESDAAFYDRCNRLAARAEQQATWLRQMKAAGISGKADCAQGAALLNRLTREDFEQPVRDAQIALDQATAEVAAVIEQQTAAGRRTGQLRQRVIEAEAWQKNGLPPEAPARAAA